MCACISLRSAYSQKLVLTKFAVLFSCQFVFFHCIKQIERKQCVRMEAKRKNHVPSSDVEIDEVDMPDRDDPLSHHTGGKTAVTWNSSDWSSLQPYANRTWVVRKLYVPPGHELALRQIAISMTLRPCGWKFFVMIVCVCFKSQWLVMYVGRSRERALTYPCSTSAKAYPQRSVFQFHCRINFWAQD